MKTDAEILKEMRETAERIELKAVTFLDANGAISSRYETVRLEFHDGTVIEIPKRLEPQFLTQRFNLRPVRNDA